MKIKYLGIALVFFLVLGIASAADADDLSIDDFKNINYSDKQTQLSIENYNFTIPEGYGPIEKVSGKETQNGVTQDIRFFANEEGDVIMACVMSGDDLNLELDTYDYLGDNPQKMTINGHDGTLLEKGDYYFFVYIDGDCVILVQAKDKNLFEDIID